MSLNTHRSIVLALVLATASCSKPGLNSTQQDEVVDIANDAASSAVSELESRVAELESQVSQLESDLEDVQTD